MSGLQKDPAFIIHLTTTRCDQPYVISNDMQGRVGRGVDEFVFLPNTIEHKKYTCQQKDKIEKPDEKKPEKAAQSFLRVFNTKTFFPTTDATLTITPEEYKAAQKLGLTKHIDQALTAKLIGTLGDFRYESRKDAVLYGIYDDMYVEEEAICQTIFKRIEALQALELAHGSDAETLLNILIQYKKWAEIELELIDDLHLSNIHENLLDASYQRDLSHVEKLIEKTKQVIEKKKNSQTPLYDDTLYDDTLKNDLENFLHERLNEAIRHGRETDELITVGSRINIFRGRLTGALVRADQMITEHRFDQDRSIHQKHQGDYRRREREKKRKEEEEEEKEEKEEKDQRITLASFHTQLGSQKTTLERFALTAALILGDPPSDDPMTYEPNRATWSSPGWARVVVGIQKAWQEIAASAIKFWREIIWREAQEQPVEATQPPSILQKYEAYIDTAEEAKLSFISVGLQDLSNLLRDGVKALWLSFASVFSSLFEALIKLALDFNDNSNGTQTPQKHLTDTVEELKENLEWNTKTTHEQVQAIFVEIFKRIAADRASVHPEIKKPEEEAKKTETDGSIKGLEAKEKTLPTNENIKEVIKKFIAAYEEAHHEIAPFALPPHPLTAYNPDDLLSASWSGMESFYQFFANMHDENPSICIYAISTYLLAIASMIAPNSVAAAGSKAGIPIETFVEFNRLSGAAMANDAVTQIASVAFTDWQIVAASLEGLMGGEDSILGNGARFARRHVIQTVGGLTGIYGIGVLVTHLIPLFKQELGNTPEILEFFTGLKVAVSGYEAFESAPHERSLVGAFLFDLMDVIVLIGLRCPLSIVNALYMAILRPIGVWIGKVFGLLGTDYPIKPFNWVNVLRPWAELMHKVISACVRLFDFLIRILNLLGRILKMFSKALTDFIFGLLIVIFKAVPILILLLLFIPIYLLWPSVGKRIVNEISQTLRGLKDDAHAFLTHPRAVFRRMIFEEIEQKQNQKPSNNKQESDPLEKWSGEWIAFKIWHCDTTPVPQWLLTAKFGLYRFFDQFVTRPVKNAYKACRNQNARYLKRREAQLDQRLLRWVAGTTKEAKNAVQRDNHPAPLRPGEIMTTEGGEKSSLPPPKKRVMVEPRATRQNEKEKRKQTKGLQ